MLANERSKAEEREKVGFYEAEIESVGVGEHGGCEETSRVAKQLEIETRKDLERRGKP